MLLVTTVELDFNPLITSLWAQDPSEYSSHFIIDLSSTSLLIRKLCETVPKELIKTNCTTCTVLPCPALICSISHCNKENKEFDQVFFLDKYTLADLNHPLVPHVFRNGFWKYFAHNLPRVWWTCRPVVLWMLLLEDEYDICHFQVIGNTPMIAMACQSSWSATLQWHQLSPLIPSDTCPSKFVDLCMFRWGRWTLIFSFPAVDNALFPQTLLRGTGSYKAWGQSLPKKKRQKSHRVFFLLLATMFSALSSN